MEEEAVSGMQQIDLVEDALAKSMYRVGFRALEEVAEASVEELAGIQGISDTDHASRIKEQAASTMERLRNERIRELATRDEPPAERERLLCVRGLGARTLTLLEDGGYKSLASVVKEDADRLGIRTGLGLKKAAAVKRAAEEFARIEPQLYAAARAAVEAERAAAPSSAEENGASEPGATIEEEDTNSKSEGAPLG
jgi:N utilization substance protein A